jgi:hypothetical protein
MRTSCPGSSANPRKENVSVVRFRRVCGAGSIVQDVAHGPGDRDQENEHALKLAHEVTTRGTQFASRSSERGAQNVYWVAAMTPRLLASTSPPPNRSRQLE